MSVQKTHSTPNIEVNAGVVSFMPIQKWEETAIKDSLFKVTEEKTSNKLPHPPVMGAKMPNIVSLCENISEKTASISSLFNQREDTAANRIPMFEAIETKTNNRVSFAANITSLLSHFSENAACKEKKSKYLRLTQPNVPMLLSPFRDLGQHVPPRTTSFRLIKTQMQYHY